MVTPEVLVWARESAGLGLQQAAERAKVRPEALAKWEAGAEWPSLVQVRKLGRVYKRPLAVFYLPKPPKGRQVLRDFRRIPNTQRQAKSPELRLEERRAHRRQSVAVELSELIGESAEPLPFRTKFGESPTDLAIAIRKALATNASRATTEAQALLAWRAAVERLGVLVFQFTGRVDDPLVHRCHPAFAALGHRESRPPRVVRAPGRLAQVDESSIDDLGAHPKPRRDLSDLVRSPRPGRRPVAGLHFRLVEQLLSRYQNLGGHGVAVRFDAVLPRHRAWPRFVQITNATRSDR